MIRLVEPADGEQLDRVHESAWRAAYSSLVPLAFLDSVFSDAPARAAWRAKKTTLHEGRPTYVALDPQTHQVCGFLTLLAHAEAEEADLEMVDPVTGEVSTSAATYAVGIGEISSLHLAASAFGRGIASALLRYGLAVLREEFACTEVVLWVVEKNSRARRFYEKEGFLFDHTFQCVKARPLVQREVRYRRRL